MMLLVEDRGGWEIKLFASNDLLSLNLHTAFYFSLCKEQCPWRCTHFEPLLGSKPFSECCDALRHFFITDILYLFLNPPEHVTPLNIYGRYSNEIACQTRDFCSRRISWLSLLKPCARATMSASNGSFTMRCNCLATPSCYLWNGSTVTAPLKSFCSLFSSVFNFSPRSRATK